MNRALIACGGTGGHLSPGIAMAQELAGRGWECRLLISSKEVDSRLASSYKEFEYEAIPGSGFGLRPLKLARFVADFIKGYAACSRMVARWRPDVVLGFGGFISAPALFAGRRQAALVAIHEANRVPGRATRLTSLIANRIYLPRGIRFEGRRSKRVCGAGMPIRSEFAPISGSEAKRSLDFDPRKPLLVVFGGSQGARSLTTWSQENASWLASQGIQLLCLTGMDRESGEAGKDDHGRSDSRFLAFSDDMPRLLSAADLVVSRGGAGSLAEIARCRAPAIVVPYPFAADDHQSYNARRFEAQGGGICLKDDELDTLSEKVLALIVDRSELRRMAQRLELIDKENSRQEIADDLVELLDASRCRDTYRKALRK